MEGQMMYLYRTRFAIDLTNPKELKYWSERLGVTAEQLAAAARQAPTPGDHNRLIHELEKLRDDRDDNKRWKQKKTTLSGLYVAFSHIIANIRNYLA